jgi:hypothetical protein
MDSSSPEKKMSGGTGLNIGQLQGCTTHQSVNCFRPKEKNTESATRFQAGLPGDMLQKGSISPGGGRLAVSLQPRTAVRRQLAVHRFYGVFAVKTGGAVPLAGVIQGHGGYIPSMET